MDAQRESNWMRACRVWASGPKDGCGDGGGDGLAGMSGRTSGGPVDDSASRDAVPAAANGQSR